AVATAAARRRQRPDPALAAQNLHGEAEGACTGEISAAMARDAGARYTLVGHSERRHLFGETDEQVARKVAAALAGELVPVVCVGETLEERRAGRVEEVILRQLDAVLAVIPADAGPRVMIADEPVRGIGPRG